MYSRLSSINALVFSTGGDVPPDTIEPGRENSKIVIVKNVIILIFIVV
jgi:hypothetical protein